MNKSTILTCLGAAGVIATSIMTAKATTKASKLLESAVWEKGNVLTKKETIKAVIPAYIPAALVGITTIACIFGSNAVSARQKASLASAYALLSGAYAKYKDKVIELYGDEADKNVKEEVAKEEYEDRQDVIVIPKDDEVLFFDFDTLEYFNARIEDVIQKTVMDDGLECYIITNPHNSDVRLPY